MLNGQDGLIMTFGSAGAYIHGSFFDESEQLVAGDPFCVAGFTFKDKAYKKFSRDWRNLLDRGISGQRVPFMHMNSLVGHKKHFEGLELKARAKFFEKAVDVISEHALIVTGALVDQKGIREGSW
jgi:hypothetical protein